MEAIKNVKSINISDRTREFLIIKAELSTVYRNLCEALQDVDPRNEYDQTKKLQDSLLNADAELMKYITGLMEEQMLTSDFSTL